MIARAPRLAWLVICGFGCTTTPAPRPPLPPNELASPAVAATDDQADDREFQALAIDVATRTGRVITGWGTVAFDQTPGRYATLRRSDDDTTPELAGAYLIDVAGQRWLVTFEDDGRTEPWGSDEATETAARAAPTRPEAWAWTRRPERALLHRQTHRGGYEQAEFAVFDHKLVVVSSESVDDAREDDTPASDTYTCPACPVLTGGDHSYFVQQVRGPARTIDELVDR